MPHIPLSSLVIDSLPPAEDDSFEYKSSQTQLDKLKEKIEKAASAFANSGGGCFIAGVDGTGVPDGGFPASVGRQSIRDWVDLAIARVTPPVRYEVRPFDEVTSGHLESGKVILAISFLPSESTPHMAPDHRYYIRAGAHSLPANQFIVESLWARRGSSRPLLTHTLRQKPGNSHIVQLGVISLSSAPALDVEVQFDPPPVAFGALVRPIRLPVVSLDNPFYLDIAVFGLLDKHLPPEASVIIKYRDIAGNVYEYRSSGNLREAVPPYSIGADVGDRIASAVEKLVK